MAALTGLIAAQGVSAAAGMGNAYSQAQAARAQGAYQKQQLGFNARLSDLAAQDAIRRGQEDAQRHRTATKGLIGSQRASLAAQGIEIDSGSALEIQQDTRALGELDALTIQNNARRQAWGFKVQAQDLRFQGRMAKLGARTQARSTLIAGGMGAARDAAQGAYMYNLYKKDTPKADINGNVQY